MADLVALATDQDPPVLGRADGPHRLVDADVHAADPGPLQAGGHGVGPVRVRPGEEPGLVEERQMAGHHDVAGLDGAGRRGDRAAAVRLVDVDDAAVLEDLASGVDDGGGQAQAVPPGMQLRLVGHPHRRRHRERQLDGPGHVGGETGLRQGLVFGDDGVVAFGSGRVRTGGRPLEIAVDAVIGHQPRHAFDSGGVGGEVGGGMFVAVPGLDLTGGDALQGGELGGRVSRRSGGDAPRLEDRHRCALSGEEARGGQARHASADHDHVERPVGESRRVRVGVGGGADPEGRVRFGEASHALGGGRPAACRVGCPPGRG